MTYYIVVTSNMPSSRRVEIDGPVSPHVRAALDCKGLNHPGGQPPWTEATPATVLNALAEDGYRIIAMTAHDNSIMLDHFIPLLSPLVLSIGFYACAERSIGMLILLLFLAVLLYYAQRLFIYLCVVYRQHTLLSKLPGPPAVFPVGNVLDLGDNSFKTTAKLLEWADEFRAKGHNLMRLWIGFRPMVLPLNGEALKPILDSTEELTKGDDYDFFVPWLGLGLLISTNGKWRSRRKMLTPTFHFAMLDGYVEKMDKHAKILVNILKDKIGEELDIYPYVKRCALDIICDTAMGTELDSQHDPNNPYVLAVGDFNTLARDWSLTWYYWIAPVWWLTQRSREVRLLETMTGFTKKVIANRIAKHKSGTLKFDDKKGKRKAFLDMLIEMKEANSLTDEDIREEVDTFMFEGHDTTSSGMGWVLWCLATNPEAQEQAYNEVSSVFGGSDRSITVEDLKGMPYLEKVIKETLRIFPAVPQVQRKVMNDFKIGQYTLPAGTDIMMSQVLVHHNEKVWGADHWKFDPDRFDVDRTAGRHAYDYIPFSAGLRNCIGQRFALYEEKLVIAWILRKFSIHTDRPMLSNTCGAETVLRPILGVPVTLRARPALPDDAPVA